ncbi:MAG: glycosyltransferase [Planctomycetota bacterium]|nr:MAG: glycosyltransferase [Planctomycetota bacterium]
MRRRCDTRRSGRRAWRPPRTSSGFSPNTAPGGPITDARCTGCGRSRASCACSSRASSCVTRRAHPGRRRYDRLRIGRADGERDVADSGDTAAITVAIPSYRTRRLLEEVVGRVRRWAPGAELLVVDTGSDDGSRAWAAACEGVELIALDDVAPGPEAHGAALDAALAAARRPLLLTLDSDALPRSAAFFAVLLEAVQGAAAAGTTKDPATLGRINRFFKWLRRERRGPEWRYLRPNRAIYRVETLRRLGLSFRPGRSGRVGQDLAEGLEAAGERVRLLAPAHMERLCVHLRHGTLALNPERFPGARAREIRRARRRLVRVLGRQILER